MIDEPHIKQFDKLELKYEGSHQQMIWTWPVKKLEASDEWPLTIINSKVPELFACLPWTH
jgi:hypothetical protein